MPSSRRGCLIASPSPTFSTIFSIVGISCGFLKPNCCCSLGRTVCWYVARSRGGGTGKPAPACGPRAAFSRLPPFWPPLFLPLSFFSPFGLSSLTVVPICPYLTQRERG